MSLGPDGILRTPKEQQAANSRKKRWVILAVLALVVIAVLTDLPRGVTLADRQANLQLVRTTIVTDMQVCNASLSDSLTALSGILSGRSNQVATAKQIMVRAESTCTVIDNPDLYDLATLAPPTALENLSVNISKATNNYVEWAYPNAAAVIVDAQDLLKNPKDARAIADLRVRVRNMQSEEQAANLVLSTAAEDLKMTIQPLNFDGINQLPASLR